jgi:hypothetical protein
MSNPAAPTALISRGRSTALTHLHVLLRVSILGRDLPELP